MELAGGQYLDSEWRFGGFVGQHTLRPLERGVVLLGVCSVCVCVRIVQGVSVIVLVRRRGWSSQDPMLLGPVPVFKEGRLMVDRFALVRETEGLLSLSCLPYGTHGLS